MPCSSRAVSRRFRLRGRREKLAEGKLNFHPGRSEGPALVFADDGIWNSDLMQPTSALFDDSLDPAVRGFLHSPANPNGDALILTHGAGSDCTSPLLVALGEALAGHGYTVLRCDLPFRQERRTGPPFPRQAERDRAGLRNASRLCARAAQAESFLAAIRMAGGKRRCYVPLNLLWLRACCCFPILCIRRVNRNSFVFNICRTCARPACSCMERAIRSGALKR